VSHRCIVHVTSPLQVARRLSVNDTMNLMRTHFEGTWFDPRGLSRADVGAGPGSSPYRWRPLGWQSGGKAFVNERPAT
jgi:dipeptidase